MSTQLAALGIPIRSPYAEANVPADADLVVIGNALSRGNPEVEVGARPPAALHEPARARWPRSSCGRARSLVVAGTHGKTTTTSLLAFLLHAGRPRPVVPDRRRAGRLRAQLPPRRRAALRDRGRRVRLRLLRQAAEVRALPARRRGRSATWSSTTPTSTPTSPAVQLAFVAAAARGPAQRACWSPAPRARPCVEILGRARAAASRRSACTRAPTGAPSDVRPAADGHALPAACCRARTAGEFALRARAASTTSATRSRRWRWPRPRASRPSARGAPLARFRGVKRRLEVRGRGGRRHGLRRLRPPPDGRGRRRCAALRAHRRRRPPRGRLRAALLHVADARVPGRVRARVRGRRPRRDRRGPPAGQGARGPAALGGGPRRRHPPPRRRRPTSSPPCDEIVADLAASLRPGDRVADPLERRLRRHPRQAARGRSRPRGVAVPARLSRPEPWTRTGWNSRAARSCYKAAHSSQSVDRCI